jgi:hypothetical protein
MKHLILITILFFSINALAQHEQHQHEKTEKKPPAPVKPTTPAPTQKKDTIPQARGKQAAMEHEHDHAEMMQDMHAGHNHEEMEGHDHGAMSMSHAFSRNLPMTRNGSGTSWQPDNSPMYGYMFHKNDWMFMLHGNAFIRYNKQDLFNKGSRGGSKFDIPNMVMLMGQKNLGQKGLFHFSSMLSLDPLTVGEEGYPLLFQTGESYNGQLLVDRQHPHDLFGELSVSYAHALSTSSDVYVYLGYPGEPALGPTAFIHRPSGFFNPDAPLSHHWVDATHITFGVATLGYRLGNVKLEGSLFTGREPDEDRYNFDKPRFDSWSGRLSYNPSEKWSWQVSHGFIKQPEELHPGEDVRRTTASATYSTRGFGETFTNLTALWGLNKRQGHDGENGLLAEASHSVRKTTVYGRYEWVQKSAEELNLDHTLFDHDAVFPVNAFTLGGAYDVLSIGQTRFSLGGQLSLYSPDQRLSSLYGNAPLAGQVYLRISPKAMGTKMGPFSLPY